MQFALCNTVLVASWRSHWDSSHGSSHQSRTAPCRDAVSQTKSTDLGHESACRLLSPTFTTTVYFARKPILILPSHEG